MIKWCRTIAWKMCVVVIKLSIIGAVALMMALGIAGLSEMTAGVIAVYCYVENGCSIWAGAVGSAAGTSVAIGKLFTGLEFVLISPLPLAVVTGAAEVGIEYFNQAGMPPMAGSRKNLAMLMHEILDPIKPAMVSLMATVVATDLVKRFLNHHLDSHKGSWPEIAFGLVLCVGLFSYALFTKKAQITPK